MLLIVVTSREIDQIGEDQFTWTREHMERVLGQICLAIRRLTDCGVERFVVAADHGHLYAAELSEAEKISATERPELLYCTAGCGSGKVRGRARAIYAEG